MRIDTVFVNYDSKQAKRLIDLYNATPEGDICDVFDTVTPLMRMKSDYVTQCMHDINHPPTVKGVDNKPTGYAFRLKTAKTGKRSFVQMYLVDTLPRGVRRLVVYKNGKRYLIPLTAYDIKERQPAFHGMRPVPRKR